MSGELYFQWGVMIIVFIVHSLAISLMNFPFRYFRGTAAQKPILMKAENCIAVQANSLVFHLPNWVCDCLARIWSC